MITKKLKTIALLLFIGSFGAFAQAPTQENRPPQGRLPKFSELLIKMDKNKDGKLSKAEIEGPLKNDFAKVDKNKDGFITEAEFKLAPPPKPPRGQ
jgi:hypothetical protein